MNFFEGMNPEAIVIIFGLLALFVLFAIKNKRSIMYNGEQERPGNKKPFQIWTLNNGHGTSFASKNKYVLGYDEVSSRRSKFGQTIFSKLLWAIGLTAIIFFASLFV